MNVLKKGNEEKTNIRHFKDISIKQDLYILLISCESKDLLERDNFPTDLELYELLVKTRKDIHFKNVFVQNDSYNLDGVDGIIIGGSSASVYSREKWKDTLRDQIKTIQYKNIPLLGCCFGAQIIADTLGGNVIKGKELELGVKKVYLTDSGNIDPLFFGLPNELEVISFHEDDILEIGNLGKRLAYNSLSSNQAFSMGECMKGVQFHPEYNIDTINKIEDIYSVSRTKKNTHHDGSQIINNFFDKIVYKYKYE